jgi:hypothetical protein
MIRISIGLTFTDSGYIGKPFWPETSQVINISKDVHPKLGDAKKKAAVLAACEKRGITAAQYEEIVERSKNPFYTIGARGTEIVIPERVIQSFLNNCSQEAPKAIPRIAAKGLTFIGVKIEDGFLRTGKTEKDAKRFGRFVKNQESNQRMWSEDPYIIDFTATGILRVDEEIIRCADLQKMVEHGGRMYGIGTARPQGFGRFVVTKWDKLTTGSAAAKVAVAAVAK